VRERKVLKGVPLDVFLIDFFISWSNPTILLSSIDALTIG
jgi:hypothetical protein